MVAWATAGAGAPCRPNVEAIFRLQDEIAGCSSASSLFRLLKRSQARLLVTGLVPLAWQAAAERGLLRPSPSTCKAQTRHQLLTLLVELGMRVATSLDAPALARLAAAAGAVQGGGPQVGPLLAALRRRAAQLPPAAFDPCAAIDTLCVLGCDGPQAGALLSHALDRCLPGLHAMQAAALAKLLVLLIKAGRWEDGSVGLVLATLDARIDQLDALDALCTLRCLAAWPDLSPSLISRLACHIGTRCIGLCAPDLCTLAGALLHLRHVPDETLRDGLVEAARRQVRATPPPQLARLAEAYCRLLGGFPRHRGLLQALQRRVVHSAQEWSGEDLSRLLACFARWGYDARPGPFVAVAADTLARLAPRTSHDALLRALCSLASLAQRSPAVLGQAGLEVRGFVAVAAQLLAAEQGSSRLGARAPALFAALAGLQARPGGLPPGVRAALGAALAAALDSAPAPEVERAAWALQALDWGGGPGLADALARAALRTLGALSAAGLALCVCTSGAAADAVGEPVDRHTLRALSVAIRSRLHALGPGDRARLLQALGRLARRTPGGAPAPELLDLLQLLADSVRADDLARLDPVGAAAALAACAHLPRHPGRLVETLKLRTLLFCRPCDAHGPSFTKEREGPDTSDSQGCLWQKSDK
ncbi:hypothetical protein ACKKBG_A29730 [Auxenochlorella protothecoides x Auxenochlorella symbiontica]